MEPNSEALVALAFRFGLHDLEAADLSSRGDVGAAVGLLIESDDIDHPDLRDRLRDQVDFCQRRLGYGVEGLVSRTR